MKKKKTGVDQGLYTFSGAKANLAMLSIFG